MTASNSSSLVLANIRSRTMPALLTRTSSPPNVSTAVWIRPSACCPVGDVGAAGDGFASGGGDLVDDALRRAAPAGGRAVKPHADVVDHHTGALGGERQRVRAPDAAARTRHDDHAAVEQSHIRCLLDHLIRSRCRQVVRRFAAAVHSSDCAADVGRRVRRQEGCGPADVGGLGEPAERHVRRDRRDRIRVAVEQLGLLGLDHADDDRVHPDLRRPLDGQRAGEAVDARLGRAVGRGARRRPPAADAGDVDDRAAAAPASASRRSRAVETDSGPSRLSSMILRAELRRRVRGEHVRRPARVVDHDVEPAVLGRRSRR